MTQETFNDTTDWVVPAGVFSLQIECEGSSASGSGRAASVLNPGGSSGGGGAYAKTNALPVFPGQTIKLTVNDGGAAPAAGANPGLAGGDVWASKTGVAPTSTAEGCLAKGAAAPATITTAGVGGLASTSIGDTKTAGTDGGPGGTASAGAAGGAGAAPLGGAGGAAQPTAGQNGNPGTAPGGGGGGGRSTSGVDVSGGAGAKGRIILTYTVVPSTAFLGLI